jgi:hypothetical protein
MNSLGCCPTLDLGPSISSRGVLPSRAVDFGGETREIDLPADMIERLRVDLSV